MLDKYHNSITAALPELEPAGYEIPKHMRLCGPMVLPTLPLADVDAELCAWLKRPGRRTLFINLGSHVASENRHALEIAGAIATVMQRFPDVQVLWKLKNFNAVDPAGPAGLLGEHLAKDRVRIVSWLKADPIAVLKTGRVACCVHHGGANSFYECIVAGVPHVVLPVWYDT